jgi:hypothetical protein
MKTPLKRTACLGKQTDTYTFLAEENLLLDEDAPMNILLCHTHASMTE